MSKFEVTKCDCCGTKKVVCAVFVNHGKKISTCKSCNNLDLFQKKAQEDIERWLSGK